LSYLSGGIKKYIEDIAARIPAPGGGSAAGFCGALGIALLEMVCNFTLGNDRYKDVETRIQTHLGSLKKIREEFCALIDEDVEVYSEIRSAFKSKDKKIIDKALKRGYHISLKTCRLSKDALEIALGLSADGNSNLITDVGCSAELLNAAFNSGIFNSRINLKGMEEASFREKEDMRLYSLEKDIGILYKDTISKTKERMK
jgi:formiminotetrahydrofolate cyclodeaminase